MRELIKVCNTFELKTPTLKQMEILFDNIIVNNNNIRNTLLEYIQGDFRKLEFIKKLHDKNPEILNENLVKYDWDWLNIGAFLNVFHSCFMLFNIRLVKKREKGKSV